MILHLLSRWAAAAYTHANERLGREVAELTSELEAERRRLVVASAEIEAMAAVIARDRERIKAEGAAYARARAEAEGINHDERDYESPGRRVA
jgi:molecular chaperone GrpE (heat shock protein)